MSNHDQDEEVVRLVEPEVPSQDDMLEQLLMNLILDPVKTSIKRVRVVDGPSNGVLVETKQGLFIGPDGHLQEVEEEVIYLNALDDGTPMNQYGLSRCQNKNCGCLVKEDNLTRCPCGQIVCINCARWSSLTELWYCSAWHRFLGGRLRLNLR